MTEKDVETRKIGSESDFDINRGKKGIILPQKNAFDFVERPEANLQFIENRKNDAKSGVANVRKVMEAFAQLPKDERGPDAVKIPDLTPSEVLIPSPPEGGLVLRVYVRFLERDDQVNLRPSSAGAASLVPFAGAIPSAQATPALSASAAVPTSSRITFIVSLLP